MKLIVPVDSASIYAPSLTSATNGLSTTPISDNGGGKHMLMRLLMLKREIGSIIGKNGDSINTYREKSGANIKISEKGIGERIISIYGELQDVILVCKLFCRKLEWDARHKRKPTEPYFNNLRIIPKIMLRTLFPSSICGYILGKEGRNVRRIRQETGCLLTFSPNKLPNSTERVLFLSGDALAVCDAAERIYKWVANVKHKIAVIPYHPLNIPLSPRKSNLTTSNMDLDLNGMFGVQERKITEHLTEPEVPRATNNPVLKYRPKLGRCLLTAFPSPQLRPIAESGEQDLRQGSVSRKLLGGWNILIRTPASTPPHLPISFSHPHSQTEIKSSRGEGAHTANSMSLAFSSPPPTPPHKEPFSTIQDPHLPFRFNVPAIPADIAASIAPPYPNKAAEAALQRHSVHELTHEMVLPNDLIGCIIGRGGLKINEIRRVSQASIKISNDEKDSSFRQITVAGTPQAINSALLLIHTSLFGRRAQSI